MEAATAVRMDALIESGGVIVATNLMIDITWSGRGIPRLLLAVSPQAKASNSNLSFTRWRSLSSPSLLSSQSSLLVSPALTGEVSLNLK